MKYLTSDMKEIFEGVAKFHAVCDSREKPVISTTAFPWNLSEFEKIGVVNIVKKGCGQHPNRFELGLHA